MARSYENARRMRRVMGFVVPVVWIGGLWLVTEWVAKGLFGLEGVWAWLVGGGCLLVGLPVAGYLLYLGVVVLWPVVTGKKIDWR